MLDLMQTELGVIANTVSAGKWDRSQNLVRTAWQLLGAARRHIRGEDVLVTC